MPKQTRKYRTACELADQLNISDRENQERLYRLLNEANYYWNSGTQEWQHLNQDAKPPTELIHIRVIAESSKAEGVAYQVRVAMEEQGYHFMESSQPYPCRPPKQLESRVYLTFK